MRVICFLCILWPALLIPLNAATADQTTANSVTTEETRFFESRIRPLFAKHCYSCHSREAKTLQGGLRLDRAEPALKGGDRGAAIVRGQPDKSLLIEAVRYQNAELEMPPAGKLTDAEIADLTLWVQRGAQFPETNTAEPDAKPKRVINLDEGRRFWAFRPLEPVGQPSLKNAAWVQRPLDVHILAKLEAAGRSPAPPADRRTLIRRAAFDLVGLPPTPDEVSAFIQDESADAYPQLVERLLASPHYGERWGRFWLDLVRYCDIPESWAQSAAHPWLYRDWVVSALNEDLSYDQFVTKQLAADQLPEFQPADIAALGFLGLSPSYWKELKLAPDVIKTVVAEEWEERINTVTSAFLGLTVACARCHDHKFDPITQQDYYALAGVFASMRQVPLPLLPRAEAQRVGSAHLEVKFLEAEVQRLMALAGREKDKEAEWKLKAEAAKAQAEVLKRDTPHYADPLAYAIEDAAIAVEPDGPNQTKVTYQPGAAQDVALQIRGEPSRPEKVVSRRFLSVLSAGEPPRFTNGGGRLELAQAIFREGSPLAARVIVNRVWQHHFGRGLVDTPSNFGVQGSRPTHPELLDDLAARFIAQGWSLKWLHREILLSATWRQSSMVEPAALAADPENRLLGRMPRRRLEVEAWRDSMLAAAGNLDLRLGGSPADLNDATHVRRTLYGTVKRRELHDLLRLFDFPDPTTTSAARLDTTTPLQQLYILNGDLIGRQAGILVARIQREFPENTAAQIARAYALLFQRPPTPRERELAEKFLRETAGEPAAAWQQYAEVLLASNELLFAD